MRRIKEKKERSLGVKLFLKAERCGSHKCVMIRRPYRPGQHGRKRRSALSDYGRQLQEKQKIQIIYGLTNRQMRNLFLKYPNNPEKIIETLERRLDRVVYYLGLAPSVRVARQIVSHGHILVNGRRMTIPSYQVKKGDKISIRERSKSLKLFEGLKDRLKDWEVVGWLKMDKAKFEGECVDRPDTEIVMPFDINLVGEFYLR